MNEAQLPDFDPCQITSPEKLYETVERLSGRYPFLTASVLGKSILGKDIPVLVLGKGNRHILYVGAHHGMEWITSNLLLRFLFDFCECYQSGRTVYRVSLPAFWEQYSLHIVPMLNPDGVEYQMHGIHPENPLYERILGMNGGRDDFSHWQANARGVDLNHNYNAGFAEYKRWELENKILGGAPGRYSGQAPESEPEVRALCNYIRFYVPRFVMTLHTQGEEILFRSRGKTVVGTEAGARKTASICGYRLADATGPAAYGGLTDWCVESNLPALTIECGKGINPLPASDAPAIYSVLREVFFAAPSIFC